MSKRNLAKITGWLLILMALVAGFSFGYAYPVFYNSDQLDLLQNNLIQNINLFQSMLISVLIIALLDLVVSYTLYRYFEDDNRNVSLVAAILRIIYTIVFGAAIFCLTKNLNPSELSNDLIVKNFNLFQFLWSIGLILFGAHLFLIGYLMKIHNRIPKVLWYLTLIAGASYIVVHFLKLITTQSDIVSNLEMSLALPMAIGELGLAVWFTIKGGKEIN